ncbi:hypothetical protein KUTeg_014593, partial [Tegillarca granosa]
MMRYMPIPYLLTFFKVCTVKDKYLYITITSGVVFLEKNVGKFLTLDITPEDPRWVGAWWLGFLAGSIMFLSISIPLFGFGKELPVYFVLFVIACIVFSEAEEIRLTRVSQVHKNKADDILSHSEVTGSLSSLKDLPKTALMLLRNSPFLLVTLAGAVEALTVSGFSTFMPKFIQNQFGVTASKASILG